MTTAPTSEDFDVVEDLKRLLHLKQQKAEIEKEIDFIQKALCGMDFQVPVVEDGDVSYRVAVVRSETFEINDAKLKQLNPELYPSLCKSVFDAKKFEKAVETGLINASIIEEVVTIKSRTPYIKLTPITEGETHE